MSRVAQRTKKTLISAAALLVIAGGGVGLWLHNDSLSNKPTVTLSQSTVAKPTQTTSISYEGEDGQNALVLLKKHAQVQTKSSSIGEYVTSINGNNGGGSKYWIFYVNGQESQVGASAYVTKNSDQIEWKLQ